VIGPTPPIAIADLALPHPISCSSLLTTLLCAEGEQFANAFFTLETKIKIAKAYVQGKGGETNAC
jgi:hypothetical protein